MLEYSIIRKGSKVPKNMEKIVGSSILILKEPLSAKLLIGLIIISIGLFIAVR